MLLSGGGQEPVRSRLRGAPPYVAGRGPLTHNTIQRLAAGPGPRFHTLVLGPRGTGKTVWLGQIASHVESEMGGVVLEWNAADRDRPLRRALAEQLPTLERQLTSRVRRGALRVQGGVTVKVAPAGIGAEASARVSRSSGSGDSASIVHLLTGLGELAKKRRKLVVVRVDELQGGGEDDLVSLGAAIQTVANEKALPVALIAVGLPSTRDVLHDLGSRAQRNPSAGFLERQKLYWIGNLDEDATLDAFERPIIDAGWSVDADALDEMAERSNGYPYAIQLIGYETWDAVTEPGHINLDAVRTGMSRAVNDMATSCTCRDGDR